MLSNIKQFICLPPILFLVFLFKWLQTKSCSAKPNLPPSPPKLPILGNLHQLGTHPHCSLNSLSQQYGDLIMVYFGTIPVLVVSSKKQANKIMRTQDAIFCSKPASKNTNKLLSNGKSLLIAPYGEYWRQMKSICVLHLLNNTSVRSFRATRQEEIELFIKKIKNSLSTIGDQVNLSELFMTFTNDIICSVAFSRKYSAENKAGTDFNKLLREFFELLVTFSAGNYIPWLRWIDWINGFNIKANRVIKEFDRFLEGVVQEHKDLHCFDREGEGKVNKDFVDVLLNIQNDEKNKFLVDNDCVKALILDMFAAGTDTTFTALEWTMTEILRHPIVMQELHKEIHDIIGHKSHVTEEDLEKMKYLKAVIKETLRLHPPVPLIPRESVEEAYIDDYNIPKGTMTIFNIWGIQRDPSVWDEPNKFSPERFLNSQVNFKGQDFEFIPFGAGRRMCPGTSFAMVTVELLLANLIHKFDWTLPSAVNGETLDVMECFGATVCRKTPLIVAATPKNEVDQG